MGLPSPTVAEPIHRNWRLEINKAENVSAGDRSAAQKDRDRLIYTSALRRLAGVTQVVGPLEGHVFHNRLTHTLKVAQIARRLAERLASIGSPAPWGLIDPDVVEAAALAHDLGHPPFGHIAERELDERVRLCGDPEGYEGNAQSFRILTCLANHQAGYDGLDLTRATLNAVLKYPWRRKLDEQHHKHYEKFGYYSSEARQFEFARQGFSDETQSIEAAIMDRADEITYSVHDLEDFFRAGLVPLQMLRYSEAERNSFFDSWLKSPKPQVDAVELKEHAQAVTDLLEFWPTDRQFAGTRDQRKILRWTTSELIGRYVRAISISSSNSENPLVIPPKEDFELRFLQRLVRYYVIGNPRLATQQAGQRRVIATLYMTYWRAVRTGDFRPLPAAFVESAEKSFEASAEEKRRLHARVAADIVSSFADAQANLLFRRLRGVSPGSVSDILEG